MRREHLEAIAPVCPTCRDTDHSFPLRLAAVWAEDGEHVVEGVLHCSNPRCLREYPILDGVPVLVANLRAHVQGNPGAFFPPAPMHPNLESLLGDCAGPDSPFERQRRAVAQYARDHWGALDERQPGQPCPALGVFEVGQRLAPTAPSGHPPGLRVELGCGPGRVSFALAASHPGLTLGVDLDLSFLRVAARALRTGRVRYPRRRVGLVYDVVEHDLPADLVAAASRLDFWMADAMALPFGPATFEEIVSLHLLDCVSSPWTHAASLDTLLGPGGVAILGCPYDWATSATPVEAWLGGHSQRGPEGGAAELALRALFDPADPRCAAPGLAVVASADVRWRVSLHDRAELHYTSDLLALQKRGTRA